MSSQHSSSTTSDDVGSPDAPLVDAPLINDCHDGIQQFDNPIPGWWKLLFVATIAFSVPYFMFYHGGAEGRTLADSYDRALATNLQLQFAEIGEVKADRANMVKFLHKPNLHSIGKSVFKSNCTSCHGSDGGGLIGPNLCDEKYKNVRDIGDFIKVLQKGAGAGAMPAWKNRLTTNEIVMVSVYVASLRGTTPAKAKAPEGVEIAPWPSAVEETGKPSGEATPVDTDA